MKSIRLGWSNVGLVSIAIAAATCAVASAEVIKVVSPSSAKNAEGNLSGTPIAGEPGRVQFLYLASDFAQLPATHRQIVAFNRRADGTQNQPNNWTYPDVEVWMSTTTRTSLLSVFADNHGPNKSKVHDGSLVFPIIATGPAGGPKDVADGARLDTPFFYDPSQGNLLVELAYVVAGPSFPSPTIDVQSAAEARFLATIVGMPNSTSGSLNDFVPVAQFEFVPEPSTFVLAGVSLVGLLAWRRKTGGFRRRMRRDSVD
jgi:hypothetical protein